MKKQISPFAASLHLAFLITLLVAACGPASVPLQSTATPIPTATPTALPPDAGWACSSPVTDAWGGSGLGDPYSPFWGNDGYDVQHYEINLEVDVEGNRIQGLTTIFAETTQDLDAFNLDFLGMEVSSILVNGTEVDFCRDDIGELTIILPRLLSEGASFTTVVSYQGTPMSFGAPGLFSYGWVKANEGVFTSGPPNDPGYLYPNNAYFNELATYTIKLTVPEGYRVSTVGSLGETIRNDGKVTTS